MIDREAAGAGRLFRKNSASSGGNNQDQIGISNKTIVYLVTIVLIVILCIVYVMQLRDARRNGGDSAPAAVTVDAAQTAEPAAEAPAETPAGEAAETPAGQGDGAEGDSGEQKAEEKTEDTPEENAGE